MAVDFQTQDIVGQAQQAYHSGVQQYQVAADNMRKLSEARRKLDEEKEALAYEKKRQNLELEGLQLKNLASTAEIEDARMQMKIQNRRYEDIMRGQHAAINMAEQKTKTDAADSMALATGAAALLDSNGIQPPANAQTLAQQAPVGGVLTDGSQFMTGASGARYQEHYTPYGKVRYIPVDETKERVAIAKEKQQALNQKKQDFNATTKVREEFLGLPETKDYIASSTSVKSMDTLFDKAKKGNIQNKVALDQSLVTLYNKLTDPSSVVRESEYARTPENLPFFNRIGGAIEKVQKGGAGLTDKDREALIWGAKIIADERGKVFNARMSEYETLADQYGLDKKIITRNMKMHEPYFKETEQAQEPISSASTGDDDLKRKYGKYGFM